jgi:hypothetical protein
MALKKQHLSDIGVDLPEAYFKIASIAGSKLGAVINVDVYANYIASTSNAKQIESMQFTFTPSLKKGDWDAQAYEHLKTLPEFASAVSC